MTEPRNRVLILGSAPSAVAARQWPRAPFTHIVAINNAWRVRPDWDVLIHPEDFPVDNRPAASDPGQRIVEASEYVPLQNAYGGFVYAGGTMALTAGYWALASLRPAVLAYFGCDMIYPKVGKTHFYGRGAADPLRDDVTLRSLEAKSARLGLFGAAQGCRVVRLSQGCSRLVYPSVSTTSLMSPQLPSTDGMDNVLRCERDLGYYVLSGRYWEHADNFDVEKLDVLDDMWLSIYSRSGLENVA